MFAPFQKMLNFRQSIPLSKYRVEGNIQIDKQFPSTELDKYLLLEICKEAAEAVKM